MAKKTKNAKDVLTKLGTIIPRYIEVKTILDDYKKQEAELNKQIKLLMAENHLEEWVTENGTIQYSERESDIYDEEAMLDYMHKHKVFEPCIKTKEYFDADVLEDLMYKGEISKKLQVGLDSFRTTKVTPVLTLKKKKG